METYVVWDRCKVQIIQGGGLCPDVDIRLAASNNKNRVRKSVVSATGAYRRTVYPLCGQQRFRVVRILRSGPETGISQLGGGTGGVRVN